MNGEIPSVPITTLAGISSLTDCKYWISKIFLWYIIELLKLYDNQSIFDLQKKRVLKVIILYYLGIKFLLYKFIVNINTIDVLVLRYLRFKVWFY